ncbi:Thiol-disulfide oxidoreductase ResA [bacterium HR10]|nr:Thiol-disulfide oxidoreductase ResA [bacterium HR10]
MSPPHPGELLPDVTVVTVTGQQVRISDYRGQRALVLFFLGEHHDAALIELLRALADRYAEIRQEEAEVLVIAPNARTAMETIARAPRTLPLPFPILVDEGGRAHRAYGVATSGALYIADRYGEIYFARVITEVSELPTVEHILSWVRFTEAQCPE